MESGKANESNEAPEGVKNSFSDVDNPPKGAQESPTQTEVEENDEEEEMFLEVDSFDVVVAGTGLGRSILAGALARAGKKVLHLDSNDFYGGPAGSMPLHQLQEYIDKVSSQKVTSCSMVQERNLKTYCLPSPREMMDIEQLERNKFKKELLGKRGWNIDLSPHPLFSREKMIDLLVETKCHNYIDFRCLSSPYISLTKNKFMKIPCSKADVFKSRDLSLKEKRLLSKYLSATLPPPPQHAAGAEYATKKPVLPGEDLPDDGTTLSEYMKGFSLTEKLEKCITYGICFATDFALSKKEAIVRQSQYALSVGRFGPSPFIFPSYGSGELTQAFCRVCAVVGGMYLLRVGIDKLHIKHTEDTPRLEAVTIFKKQRITCEHLITSSSYLPGDSDFSHTQRVSKSIFLCKKPLLENENEETLVIFSPGDDGPTFPIYLLQLSSKVAVCPAGYYVIYASTLASSSTPREDLSLLSNYFDTRKCTEEGSTTLSGTEKGAEGNETKPSTIPILWGVYFRQNLSYSSPQASESNFFQVPNIHIFEERGYTQSFDSIVKEVKDKFHSFFPDLHFYPPNPYEKKDEEEDEEEEEEKEASNEGEGDTQKEDRKTKDKNTSEDGKEKDQEEKEGEVEEAKEAIPEGETKNNGEENLKD